PRAPAGRSCFAERAGVLMKLSHAMIRRALPWMTLFAALTAQAADAPPAAATHAPSAAPKAHESLLSCMDPAVLPGNDFNAYASGGWLKATEIPADRAYWGTGSIVAERTLQRTQSLLEQAAKDAAAGSEARKIGDYYASFMDEAGIEKKGLEPLQRH